MNDKLNITLHSIVSFRDVIIEKYKKIEPVDVYIFVTGLFFIISLLHTAKSNGISSLQIMFAQGADRFMDFFNHISYVRIPSQVYSTNYNACFPPLIYILYYCFSRILTPDATVMLDAGATTSQALLLFIIYNIILIEIFIFGLYLLLKKVIPDYKIFLLGIMISLSNVFIFGIVERGNCAFIVLILLIYSIYFSRSNNKIVREISLILIAIAAAIKIYPSIFGLLYIKKSKIKECFRLLIYGILFFFVPFLFFGGKTGFMQFIQNQLQLQNGFQIGFRTVYTVCNWINLSKLYVFAEILIAIVLLTPVFLCKTEWKKYFLLSLSMIILPKWGGCYYTGIYMVLPLLLYINEAQEKLSSYQNGFQYIYILEFSMMLLPFYLSLDWTTLFNMFPPCSTLSFDNPLAGIGHLCMLFTIYVEGLLKRNHGHKEFYKM